LKSIPRSFAGTAIIRASWPAPITPTRGKLTAKVYCPDEQHLQPL
jgi:hypothetical protein